MVLPAVFISYRRDDCSGYAGRVEEALERALGAGAVFRDVRDVAAGEDFAQIITSCLSKARVTLVLIGPRWAGAAADGRRRLDDRDDFVRVEVASALASNCKVIPVLLAGASLPRLEELPDPLKRLTERQALRLNESSWETDVAELVRSLGLRTTTRRRLIAAGIALAVLGAGGAVAYVKRSAEPSAATTEKFTGLWRAHVRYAWGDEHEEQFEFKKSAGALTGTVTYLEYPRVIEELTIEDERLTFVIHSKEAMSGEERQATHRYAVALDGDRLRIQLQSTGGFSLEPPLEFTAERAAK